MDDTIAGPSSVSASAVREKQKIGHRRIDRQGEVSYKKVPTNALMGAIQLGISNSIGFVQQRPVRDLLLQDFAIIEHANFPSEGSLSTPSHSFGNFSFKTYAPLAFRHFREMFNIKPADFLRSLCTEPLRELSNPGASGSIFYVSMDDCFIIKTVQHKEAELLQKLLPGYFMNFHQNPKTLLPKFFGLFCYQSLGKNIRLLVMNNLLPQVITMHEKYDLKGSTYKRLASAREKQKSSPTLKDLDFIDNHPQGILVEAHAYEELISTFKKDCLVLESFKIMDYSLLVGIHNIEQAERTARAEREQEKTDERPCVLKLATGQLQEPGASYSSDRNEESSKSNSKKADRSVVRWESEQRYEEAAILGAVPARNTAGDRLLLFLGIIDILQNYRLLKKLEHTWKSVLHDGDSISVHNPSFYKKRFIDFCTEHVFKKAPVQPRRAGVQARFRTLVHSFLGVGDRDEEAYQQGQQPSIVVVDRSPGEPQPSSSHQAQASTSKAAQSSSTFVTSSSNGPSASAATTPAPAPVAPSRGGVRRSYQRQDTFDLTRASTKRVERLFAPSSGSDNENLGESSGAQVTRL